MDGAHDGAHTHTVPAKQRHEYQQHGQPQLQLSQMCFKISNMCPALAHSSCGVLQCPAYQLAVPPHLAACGPGFIRVMPHRACLAEEGCRGARVVSKRADGAGLQQRCPWARRCASVAVPCIKAWWQTVGPCTPFWATH